MVFMDIAKKQKIILLIQYFLLFLFLLTIGSGNVISPLYGDVNMLDEGQYGAWMMHLFNGGHLYTDTYGAYGPFYIYPIYILSTLFSPTVFLIRVVYIVFNVFFAVIIAQLILREMKIPYYLQLLGIALLVIIPGFVMRQGMGLLSLFLIYKSVEKKNQFWSFLAGATLAATFLTSSDMGIFSLVISIGYLTFTAVKTKYIKEFLKKIALIFSSYFIVFFIFYLWSAGEGWFYSYIHSVFSDLIIYSNITIAIGKKFPNIFELMPHSSSILQWMKFIVSQQMLLYWLFCFYIVTFIYFLIKIVLKKYNEKEDLVVMVSLFGFFLSTILIGRVGHLTFTLPPVFILFAYFLKNLISSLKRQKEQKEKVVSILLISVILLFSIRLISIYRPHFIKILEIPKTITLNKNTPAFVGPITISKEQTASISALQSFVKTHTTQKDSVYFFSNTPMLYLLIDKVSPSKYDFPEVANSKEKRSEVLHELHVKKPKYIIYDLSSYDVDGVSNYARLPEVAAFIKSNYTQEKIGSYIIYSLKK